MYYQPHIDRAIATSPELISSPDRALAHIGLRPNNPLAALSDYAEVPVNFDVGIDLEPEAITGGRIFVPSLAQLSSLQTQLGITQGMYSAEEHAELQNQVEHEKEHAIAGWKIGARSMIFCVQVTRVYPSPNLESYNVMWRPRVMMLGLRTTKLALASITAYPKEPSAHDVAGVVQMGYSDGIAEVAERIKDHNRSHNAPLPIPKSA